MYQKVDAKLDFVKNEKEVMLFWREKDIFKKSVEKNVGKPLFNFYDGPPTANGVPHIGHVLTRSIKDIFPRFKNMKGYYVPRIAGWDTHGLPVELEVEKQLGINGKKDIENYGIEAFVKKCKESVWKYKQMWEELSERVGYWVDMDNPYITYENNYIESEWWALKTMFDRGLIYRGYKIVPYCPRCGTALSSHELAQNYKDVKEKSAFVKFKSVDEDAYFLAWTTTPWTLVSNVALCVHPELKYVKIQTESGEVYYLAESLANKYFENYTVISTCIGKDLEYKKYQPLYNYFDIATDKAYYITVNDYVTAVDGTGIVHIAPAFGEDDSKVGAQYDLPFVQAIDTTGKFKSECGVYADMFFKVADKAILKDLAARELLHKDMMYEHSYPHCWRCETPLVYYARDTWFIKTTAVKDELIANNQSINWLPDNIKNGRMGNFLVNNIDWGISRERYWGTPLPFWVCKNCGKTHVIGSIDELRKRAKLSAGEPIELHRPYVDTFIIECECGEEAHRTPEVMDCWFDSGSMPYAQLHYPFENVDLFKQRFPAQFISEGLDQTRGWFYSLLATNTILFGKAPFENCIALGMVNDKNGVKMSKHVGNVVNPWDILDKEGADALRWYFYISNQPWLGTSFDEKNLIEQQRKMFGTLWNVYSFYILYAEIDGYDPNNYILKDCKLSMLDRWLLSRYNTLVAKVNVNLDNYLTTDSAREIAEFVDVLSNWYIRRSRENFWANGETEGKMASFTTLYTVLSGLIKLLAPFAPFITENIYQNIVRSVDRTAPISVHMCDYPEADNEYIDTLLEAGMQEVLDIVTLGRNARNATSIKNRQVLGNIYVYSVKSIDISNELIDVIKDEMNVAHFSIIDSAEQYLSYALKPNLKTLGPKYSSLLPQIRSYLSSCDAVEVVSTIKADDIYRADIDGVRVELTSDDVLVNVANVEGYSAVADGKYTVILDTTLTDELRAEGLMREFISKLQNMRKDSGLEVTDRIDIIVKTRDMLLTAMIDNKVGYLKQVLLSETFTTIIDDASEMELNSSICDIIIKKVK